MENERTPEAKLTEIIKAYKARQEKVHQDILNELASLDEDSILTYLSNAYHATDLILAGAELASQMSESSAIYYTALTYTRDALEAAIVWINNAEIDDESGNENDPLLGFLNDISVHENKFSNDEQM